MEEYMRTCLKILFLTVFVLISCSWLSTDVLYYSIDRNEDDGMELDDALWMENGHPLNEPNIYLGRLYNEYSNAGLRFHLDDLNQGDHFALARLRFIPVAASIESTVKMIFRGVDQDSTSGFHQENRPSQQSPLTDASIPWEFQEWHHEDFHAQTFSPDISDIINEILSRPDWGTGPEGKTLSLLINENGLSDSEINYATFEAFYGGTGRPVVLELYASPVDTFVGGPILSKPKAASISISLVAGMKSDFYVEYGPATGNYTKAIGYTRTDLPDIDPVIALATGQSRELRIADLSQNTRYYYRLRARKSGSTGSFDAGPEYSFVNRRTRGETFNFAVLSDSHVGTIQDPAGIVWETGARTIQNVLAENPDFFISNGDDAVTRGENSTIISYYDAYLRYGRVRQFFGPLGHKAYMFLVLGNHEGEASFHPPSVQQLSYAARRNFIFNPDAGIYPYGGGSRENYFAWEWGDALFVCLDVFSYTGPDNPKTIEPYGSGWHLGEDQINWLGTVLSTSQARWKFLFAHHILASWEKDGYGRGGAKYAGDWEQGIIQQMMLDYGARIFFYGHDHVFADGIADGVHYTLCSKPIGYGAPPWADDPFFIAAYPSGFYTDKGHINVKVGPRSVWVDFVKSSLDDGENGKIIYSYHLADVTVKLTPTGSIDIYPGESLSFDAVLTNDTDEIQIIDYWITLSLPSGVEFVYELEKNKIIDPNTSETKHYNVYIPIYIDPGPYTVTAEVGDYPHGVISRDSFEGEILASAPID